MIYKIYTSIVKAKTQAIIENIFLENLSWAWCVFRMLLGRQRKDATFSD